MFHQRHVLYRRPAGRFHENLKNRRHEAVHLPMRFAWQLKIVQTERIMYLYTTKSHLMCSPAAVRQHFKWLLGWIVDNFFLERVVGLSSN